MSIFQHGEFLHFQHFGTLFSVSIGSGMGEKNDVRIKFLPQGNFVQWMECTCQNNRKHGEKCPHLAAMCIYLNQEKADELNRIGVPALSSQGYLHALYGKSETTTITEEKSISSKEKTFSFQKNLESFFSNHGMMIEKVEVSEHLPWLRVITSEQKKKKLQYRFHVDDTFQILFRPEYKKVLPSQIFLLVEHEYTAKRCFSVRYDESQKMVIEKFFFILKKGKKGEKIFAEELPVDCQGRFGLFKKEIGFIPFLEHLSAVQQARWNDYPQKAILADDQIAELIETQFQWLKDIAEVDIDPDVKKTKVSNTFDIKNYQIKSLPGNAISVKLYFNKEQKKSDDENTIFNIIKARHQGKKYLKAKSGYIKVTDEFDWLKKNLQKDGSVKLTTAEFLRLQNQMDPKAVARGSVDVVERIKKGLISRDQLPLPDLTKTKLTLRPYQEEGTKWLWWLYQNGLGGLLADEMGLGKTHQTMALLAAASQGKKDIAHLVVCPTSVIDHWVDRIKTYVPSMDCIQYHGPQRTDLLNQINRQNPSVLVTSYGILSRDIHILTEKAWNIVVLDEAHLVKNQSTQSYKAACQLQSNMRLCLTGTPLENDLFELKSLFDYINPNYLGSDENFRKKFMSTEYDPLAGIELSKLIYPFKMRRKKVDVLDDLPDKEESVRYCHLNPKQAQLYQEALNLKGTEIIEDLLDEKQPIKYIHIFSLMTLLKQICDDPGLIDPQYDDVGSGKLELFDELMAEAMETQQKIVVFSQYAQMIQRLSARFSKQGIQHVVLTGKTTKRGLVIKEFQENPHVQVFLGSLLAGGTGIDLTAASVVIHFDRWWNAAKEDQGTGRVHRIGQKQHVQIYKLVTKGTVEDKIDEIIAKKRLLFEQFIERDEQIFRHLPREDLLKLLEFSDLDISERKI